MAAARVRVVPRDVPRGAVWLGAAAGAIWGLVCHVLVPWLDSRTAAPGTPLAVSIAVQVAPLAAGPAALLPVLCRRTQRRGVLVGAGAGFMGALALADWIADLVLEPTASIGAEGWSVTWPAVIALGVALGYGALAALGVRATVRGVLFTTVEQTGTTCWRCGYDLGSAAVSVCPECATPAEPGRFRGSGLLRLIDTCMRNGRRVSLALAVLAVGAVVYQWFAVVAPAQRFLRALDPGGVHRTAWLYVPPGQLPQGRWEQVAVFVPSDNAADRGLLVQYLPAGPRGHDHGVRMRISVSAPLRAPAFLPGGSPGWPDDGTVRVYADLNGDQAERVMRQRAIPASLADALFRRADEQNWAPSTAPTGPTIVPESPVDPSEYFR